MSAYCMLNCLSLWVIRGEQNGDSPCSHGGCVTELQGEVHHVNTLKNQTHKHSHKYSLYLAGQQRTGVARENNRETSFRLGIRETSMPTEHVTTEKERTFRSPRTA